MDKLKQWVAMTLAAVLVIAAGGWLLLISPKRSEAAGIRDEAQQQLSANMGLQAQLSVLKAQAKDLPKQQAQIAAVAAKIPDNPALPSLIRALSKAATAASVELVTINPGSPTAPPVTATPGSAKAGQLKAISLSLVVVGGYYQIEQFFNSLETTTRALKVSAFAVAPGTNPLKPNSSSVDKGSLTATITATTYMASAEPVTVATSTTPAAAPVAPATSTTAPSTKGANQ